MISKGQRLTHKKKNYMQTFTKVLTRVVFGSRNILGLGKLLIFFPYSFLFFALIHNSLGVKLTWGFYCHNFSSSTCSLNIMQRQALSLVLYHSIFFQQANKNSRKKDTSQIQLPILKPHQGIHHHQKAWFSFALLLCPLWYFQNHIQRVGAQIKMSYDILIWKKKRAWQYLIC